jgi:hypothetical protein
MMTFLKGLTTTAGTVIVLVVFTYIFGSLKMRSLGVQGSSLSALWAWMLNSPLYWLLVLVLIGASVWLFRHWVLPAHP